MNGWASLGSWIVLSMSLAAVIFSVACFHMIRQILRHVLKFDPDSHRKIAEIHDEIVEREE